MTEAAQWETLTCSLSDLIIPTTSVKQWRLKFDSSSFLSSHSWLHLFLMRVSLGPCCIPSCVLRGPSHSATGQGPLKDGESRWITDGWPWRNNGC